MDDKNSILVEKIKTIIIELVHYSDDQIKINLSDYLTEKLFHNYSHLSTLFSEVKGTTIEQFYLTHKIEKVKELLVYDELNLTEIALKMNYTIKFLLVILSILFIPSCKKEKRPTLTTTEVINITGTSATSGGTITD